MKRLVLLVTILAALSCGLYSQDVQPLSPEWLMMQFERSKAATTELMLNCCSDSTTTQFASAEGSTGLPVLNAAFIDDSRITPLWSVDMANGTVNKLYDLDGDGVFDGKIVFARNLWGATALHLISPYRIVVYSVYGLVYTAEDVNRDGIAEEISTEITEHTWGTSLTMAGNLILVSTFHPLGLLSPFRITEEGVLIPRNTRVYGGAYMFALVYDANRALYGANPFYNQIVRFRLAGVRDVYGYTETVAVFRKERIYPIGLAFDQAGRMIVLSPEFRYYDPSAKKEELEPGKIVIVEPTQDPASPRVTVLSESKAGFSSTNGMAIEDTRTGGLRVYYTINPQASGQKARIEMREFDSRGRLVKVNEALPPDLSGTVQLGNLQLKKWPIILY